MCLGIPGKLIAWTDRDPLSARGIVEFDGARKECSLACVPEAAEGDYVLVHAGVAIARIDVAEAEATLVALRAWGENSIAAEESAPPEEPTPEEPTP